MKKRIVWFLAVFLLAACTGCRENRSDLNPNEPVTLTVWHVYGEQAESPMNRLIDEFNETAGREKGILLDVTSMTNSTQIGQQLSDALADKPGAPDMPDLFFCHTDNAAALGKDRLIDWNDWFTPEERAAYVADFLAEGTIGGSLTVFPVSKSTHLLFLNGTQFDRFAAATGHSYGDLKTWDGFYAAAADYTKWSGGKVFCAFDYPLRTAELDAASQGMKVSPDDEWFDFSSGAFRSAWLKFGKAMAQGNAVVSDLYSNTQVMTGEVIAGISSSAAILYYNDRVTYPDNTSEPLCLKVLPLPQTPGGTAYATQAGVGLCALKTTAQKAEAASVFAHWLTESGRNLDFVVKTGYMPVTNEAFHAISSYHFEESAYAELYGALRQTQEGCTFAAESSAADYYPHINRVYDAMRALQKELPKRYLAGESADLLAQETWQTLCSVR